MVGDACPVRRPAGYPAETVTPSSRGPYPGPVTGAARIELLTRRGCHLCDLARQVVAAVAREQDVGWVERDVDADEGLLAAYGEEVPVVLVDGVQHSYFTVDAAALAAALRPGRTGPLRWLRR